MPNLSKLLKIKGKYKMNSSLSQFLKKNAKENFAFSGKRIQRGLYRHYDGTITNADINGAANILRKVFPKVRQWDRGIVDMPCSAGCIEHPTGSCRHAA